MKTVATLAFAALLGSAAAVSAENQIIGDEYQEGTASVTFDLVRSDSGGLLEVYTLVDGNPGTLIGSEEIAVGVEREVTVPLSSAGSTHLIAIFTPDDGSAPISQEITLDR